MSAVSRDEASGATRLLADAAAAARGVPERMAATLKALFVADPYYPSERQRAVVARLLERLIADIEQDLRAALVASLGDPGSAGAIGSEAVTIAEPLLRRASLLADADLFRLLLARTEEHRLLDAMRARAAGEPGAHSAAGSLGSADPEIARAEMALAIAESRRFDGVEEPDLSREDLSAELLERLTWRIAVALRHHLIDECAMDPAGVDTAIAASVGTILAGHDEGRSLDAAAWRLARLLNAQGGIDDAQLRASLDGGRFAFFIALLAVRSGMDPTVVLDMTIDPPGRRLAVLLRAIGLDRSTALSILIDIVQLDDDSLARLVEDYDQLPVAEAIEALRPWRLAAGYRSAIADFEAGIALARAGGR